MDRTLTSFIWVWITLILIVNLFGIVGLFIGADSTWQALQKVKEIYSPFNVVNWLFGTVDPVAGIGRLRVARTASKIPTNSLTYGFGRRSFVIEDIGTGLCWRISTLTKLWLGNAASSHRGLFGRHRGLRV